MTKIMAIPADSAGNNARRFLELKNEQLVDNGIGKIAELLSGIHPESQFAAFGHNDLFRQAIEHPLSEKGEREFIGAFEPSNPGLKLVAAMELRSVNMTNLGKYFRPIDTFAAHYSASRGYHVEEHVAISSLVARKGPDQGLLLEDLLLTAIDKATSISDTVYLTLPPVDPARSVAEKQGFEPTGLGTANKHGIPHTLFVRGPQ